MTSDNHFPPLPSSALLREDVIAYLVDLQANGWTIYSENDDFIIMKNEVEKLRIKPIQRGYRIEHESTVGRSLVGSSAYSLVQLKVALSQYLPTHRPTRTRIMEQEPASNFSKIAKLIGSSRVNAVHDPYLDDKGLSNLLTLVRLANSVSPDLRLITSERGAKRLNKQFVAAFFKELGCASGQIRTAPTQKPHRRFMLLSGGQALIMGMSLNDLEKDEAVNLENDELDRPLFETEWNSGQPW